MLKRLWRAIVEFFNKPTPIEPPKPLPDFPKIALVRGHKAKSQGAQAHNGISEYDYYAKILPRVVERTENTREFKRDGRNIRQTIQAAAEWDADIIIEFHFNFYNSSVNGAEILICHESQREIASDLLSAWLLYSNKSNRGVKTVRSNDDGYASTDEMIDNGVIGCLFEPFFGDSISDYVEPEEMTKFLVGWIKEQQGQA